MKTVKFSPLNRNYWYQIVDDGLELWLKNKDKRNQLICKIPKSSLVFIENVSLNCSEELQNEIYTNFYEDVKFLLSRANPKLIERMPVWIFAIPENIRKAYEGLERYYIKEAKFMVSQGYTNNTIITYLYLTKEHCINKIKRKVDILISNYQKEGAKLVKIEMECYKKSWIKNYFPAKYFSGNFNLLIKERSIDREMEDMFKEGILELDNFQEENLQKIREFNRVEQNSSCPKMVRIYEDEN